MLLRVNASSTEHESHRASLPLLLTVLHFGSHALESRLAVISKKRASDLLTQDSLSLPVWIDSEKLNHPHL